MTPGLLVGLALLASLLLGLYSIILCNILGRVTGALDYPRDHTIGNNPVPRIGGLAIYSSSLLTLGAAWLLTPTTASLLEPLKYQLLVLGAGATLVLIIGLVDDIRGLRARWKLLGQIITAMIVYYCGLRVEVVTNPFNPNVPLVLGSLEMPLNVLWFLLAMNAMNIIDALDGLAGGVFLLAIVMLFCVSLVGDSLSQALVLASLLGSTIAFLRYNLNGSIYLGDSGSLLLGYILAGFVPLFSPKSSGMTAALLPVAVLSLPISEVIVTAVRRVWKGQPVGHPDLEHAHHRMLANGIEKRWTVLLIQFLSFICGLIALSMTFAFNRTFAYLLGALWLALIGLFLKVGYFSNSHGGFIFSTNLSKIFLDKDRILHRLIYDIKLASNLEEIESRLADVSRCLGLAYIRYRARCDGQWIEVAWPATPPEASDGSESMTFTLENKVGPTPSWEITTIVMSVTFDQSWPRLVNWLRGVGYSITQAAERLKQ